MSVVLAYGFKDNFQTGQPAFFTIFIAPLRMKKYPTSDTIKKTAETSSIASTAYASALMNLFSKNCEIATFSAASWEVV